MSLNAEEQAYLDFALASLPRWMRDDDYHLRGAAKLFGAVQEQTVYWADMTLIGHANGATSDQPDWLNQHAIDRGTRRQNGETDPALRARLRSVPDALVRSSLLAAADAILAAAGVAGSSAMVELPRDGAFSGEYANDTGTGGTWTHGTGSEMVFTPTAKFSRVPYRDPSVVRFVQAYQLVISGSIHPANDGTRTILGMSADGARVTNGSGVAEVDAGATWKAQKLDRRGNLVDNSSMAYASRGFRAIGPRPLIVIMLPFGTTAGVLASVNEMLRQKKAAGFAVLVERRINP